MKITLQWNNELESFEVPDLWVPMLEQLANLTAETEGINGDVALTFVNDEAMRELNRTYRQIDRTTDVLSFPMNESVGEELDIVFDEEEWELEEDDQTLGDIVISIPRAEEQSAEYGHSLDREVGFLFVHGLLHLLGYDHHSEAEEREMFSKQEQILSKAGLVR